MEPNGSLPSWRYHRVHTRSKVAEKTRTEKGKSLQFLDRANLNLCIFRERWRFYGLYSHCSIYGYFLLCTQDSSVLDFRLFIWGLQGHSGGLDWLG